MEEWKTYKLSEIGTVVGGATPSTKNLDNYDGEISWITPKDLSNFCGRYIFQGERNISQLGYDSCSCQMLPPGSILFSSRAPIGYVAIAGKEVCTNQGFKSVIPNPARVDSLFLYYLLKYHRDRIAELGSGTTFMEVSGSVMRNVEVSIPDLPTQKRIARLLSSIDDKVELNNHINHNLEEQAQALYKSWFVDFEPFKNGKFVDSELGIIPEGWRVLPFSAFVQISNEKVDSEFIPEFSVTNTGIIPRDAKFNKQLSASSLKNKIIRKGDLVFGMSREILNWGVMKDVVGGVSSAYTVYKIDKQIMDEDFLWLYIQHHPDYFKDLIKPAAREGQGIDKKVLASKKIYIPEDTLWIGFKEKINSLVEAQHQLMNQTDLLANLRDEVLPTLMERSPMSQNLNC